MNFSKRLRIIWSRFGVTKSDVSANSNAFFKGKALVYFMYVTIHNSRSPEEALQVLESHFSDERANRFNDDIWMELSFH